MNRVFGIKRIIQGRIMRGTDLHAALLDSVRQHRIQSGIVTGIGAVSQCTLAWYDQGAMKYVERQLTGAMEILHMHGNISLKDGDIFVHTHITLGRPDFTAIGGHLSPGTVVYACEYEIIETEGTPFHRAFDEDTGLALWRSGHSADEKTPFLPDH